MYIMEGLWEKQHKLFLTGKHMNFQLLWEQRMRRRLISQNYGVNHLI